MTLRTATPDDVQAIARLLVAAHSRYIERIGRRPPPMDADHTDAVRRGDVAVLEERGEVIGMVVLVAHADHLLVESVAVAPAHQGAGHGRALLAAAEARAAALGLGELRLYTNEAMTENLEIYPRLGWTETGRAEQHGFRRVFFAKPVGGDARTG